MSDYTKVNLLELEDSAPSAGIQGLEARFAKRDLGCTIGGLSHQKVAPNTRAPFGHRHRRQEELYVILAGGGRMKLDEDVIELGPLDAIRVAPETTRAFEAGPQGLELLAFGAPIGEERDGEIVRDWWSE